MNRLDITHLSSGALVAVTATALFLLLTGTRSPGGAAVAALLGIMLGTATAVHRTRSPMSSRTVRERAVRRRTSGSEQGRTPSDRRRHDS